MLSFGKCAPVSFQGLMQSVVITKLITHSKKNSELEEVKDAEVQSLGVHSSHDQLRCAFFS